MINLTLNLKQGLIKEKTSDSIEVFFPTENIIVVVNKTSYYYNETLRQISPKEDWTSLGYRIANLSEKSKSTKNKKFNIFDLITTLNQEEKQVLLNLIRKGGDKNDTENCEEELH